MTRSKVKLTYMTDDAMRKKTMKKRKNGLLKKLNELTTLCGIEACAVIYDESNGENDLPEVWPPSHFEVQRVINKFSHLPKHKQTTKKFDHGLFLKQRINKAKEQLMRRRRANRKIEITFWMNDYVRSPNELPSNMTMVDLNDLTYVIDEKLSDIDVRLEKIKKKEEEDMMRMIRMGDFAHSSSMSPLIAPENEGAYDNGNFLGF